MLPSGVDSSEALEPVAVSEPPVTALPVTALPVAALLVAEPLVTEISVSISDWLVAVPEDVDAADVDDDVAD